MRLLTALIVLASCGGDVEETDKMDLDPTDGVGDADTDSDSDSDADTDTDADTDADTDLDPLACVDADLGSGFVAHADTTVGAVDDASGTCGGAGAEDLHLSYTASVAAPYVVQLSAQFDSVLTIEDTCGVALACSDLLGTDERVFVDLDAGQTIIAVIDGYTAADAGEFDLFVEEVPTEELNCGDGIDDDVDGFLDCNDSDCDDDLACMPQCPQKMLGAPPETVYDSTVGQIDQQTPVCTGVNIAPDISWSFTAPDTRDYTFDTIGSEFDTVLSVLEVCGGQPLACNDDTNGLGVLSRVTVSLTKGQTVIVVVDGWYYSAGDLVLNTN